MDIPIFYSFILSTMIARLLGLVGVTVSGTNLALEAADITTFGDGITGMATSLLGIFIDLVPYLLLFAVVFMAIRMISKYLRIKGGKRR